MGDPILQSDDLEVDKTNLEESPKKVSTPCDYEHVEDVATCHVASHDRLLLPDTGNTICSLGEAKEDECGIDRKSLAVKMFWPPKFSTKIPKLVPDDQPDKINLLYKPPNVAIGRVVYWAEGTLKVGGDASWINAVFYATEENRTSDAIQFCLHNMVHEIIGVCFQDLSFKAYRSQPPKGEAATVFNIGPDPSEDYNFISLLVPCAVATAQCKSGVTKYFWIEKEGCITVLSEHNTCQEVKTFSMIISNNN